MWTHHGHPRGAAESVELREAKRLRALQALSTTWIRVVVVAMVVSPVNVRSEPTQSRQNSFGDAVDVLQPWAGGACPAGATDAVVSAGESVAASGLELCTGGEAELLVLGELTVAPAAPAPAPPSPPSPPPPSHPPPSSPPPPALPAGTSWSALQLWADGACTAGASDVVVSAGKSVAASSLEVCSGGGQAELLVLGELTVAPVAPDPAPPSPPSQPLASPESPAPPPLPSRTPPLPPPSSPPPPILPAGTSWSALQPWAGGACPAGATDVVVSAGESVVASSLELCSGGGQTELLMLGELAVTPAAPGPAPTAPPSPPPPSPPPPHAPPPFGSATPEQRGNEISAVMVAGIGISSLVGAIVLAIALRVVLKRCKESAAQSHRTMIEESGMDHVDDLVEEPALSDVKAVVDESALSHVNTL